jgi:hypothetical protein
MAKKRAENQAFEWTAKGYPRCRIYVGEQKWFTFGTRDVDVFQARRARLISIAGALTAKGLTESALIVLRKAAAAESNEAFEACVERAANIIGHATPRERRRRWHTFEEFATAYYDGSLAREFPAHVKVKATMKDDKGKLKYLSGIVGDVPLAHFSVEHAMLCMKKLPPTCKRDTTRNHYWQVMHRLLELAAFPAGLIPANPLLREHRPDITDDPIHYPYAYPLDDYRILTYRGQASSEGLLLSDIVLQALFGTGNREGGRLGEFLRGLLWPGIDPVYGRINIGPRKNGRVGSWPAQPGTIETLLALRTVIPGLGDLPGPFYALPDDGQWAKRYKKLCEVSGCRSELWAPPTEGRAAIRAYDTRATFVTLAKAFDMPEPWIMRRTGHEHSTMLATYDHARDDWRDHGLGKLVRLDVAIGRERLGLGPLGPAELAAEAAARRPETGDDDDDLSGFSGGAVRLDSGNHKTGRETEARFLVRMSVPEKWKTSMFSAVPKPGVEPGRGVAPADFESGAGVHEATDDGLTPRNPVAASHPKAHPVSSPAAQTRLETTPAERLLEALRGARHAAVDADDDEAVGAIGALIKARREVADRRRFVAELVARPPQTEAERELTELVARGRPDEGEAAAGPVEGEATAPVSLDAARRRRREGEGR